MSARVEPAQPPFSRVIQARLDQVMPAGQEPLVLFKMLARDERLFSRFMGGGLLDRGHLTMRQREIVIDRVTGRLGSEYEWGVHVVTFAAAARLTQPQIGDLLQDHIAPDLWSGEELALVQFVDSLLDGADVPDPIWDEVGRSFSEDARIELILLVGFYRTVSCLTNTLRLPLETGAARFSDYAPSVGPA